MPDNKFKRINKLLLALAITIIIAYYGFLIVLATNEAGLVIASDILSLLASFVSLLFVLNNINQASDIEKTFWKWMLLASIGYMMGDGSWLVMEVVLGQEISYPSISDFFYLVHPFFAFIAMLTLVIKSKKNESIVQLLMNISIGMTVLFIFSWEYIIQPAVASSELSMLGIIITIAYPMADLAIVLSVFLISLTHEPFTFSRVRLIFGFLLMALVDTIYMYQANSGNYFTGSLLDPLWPASLLIIATATLQIKSNKSHLGGFRIKKRMLFESIVSKMQIWIPASAMILLFTALSHDSELSVVMAGFLIVNLLLILRHRLELTENKKLAARLNTITSELEKERITEKNRYDNLTRIFTQTKIEARKDHLTNTFNRRYIDEMLSLMSSRKDNGIVEFSILLADIDHFKKVNDHFGHKAGDEVLKTVSVMLQEYVRIDEALGRYGGDEFIIFLPGIKVQEAVQIAERIRLNIEKRSIPTGRDSIQCTLSIGAAEWNYADDTIYGVIKKADAALYRAKENGRNRCEVYSDHFALKGKSV